MASRSSCVQPMNGSFVSTTWSCSCWPWAETRLVKPLAKAKAVNVALMLVLCKRCLVQMRWNKLERLQISTMSEAIETVRYLATSESPNDIAIAIWLDLPHVDSLM